ncbi:MAG: DNA mismatch repair protein MutS [Clostridiales bacterium]|nr:DNA mismatch repair protein MutS [Clostridiales bacterium]
MGLSPMMQHYLQVKENHKDCIIFYRLGDFYEMFFEDAVKASALLDLTLTGRDCGLEERAPMCGVPYHAADLYISKLVSLGEKVAICEQLTPPGKKELVKRDVVKIVTAGTVTSNELIDDKTNNFIGSVFVDKERSSFAWADITTGEFFVRGFSGENALAELMDTLVRVAPVEIICNQKAYDVFSQAPLVKYGILPNFSTFTESQFSPQHARTSLEEQFKLLTLEPFGIEKDKACISVSGALIAYLKQTQKHTLVNINTIKLENSGETMMLDVNAIRNLELVKTLKDGKRYGSLLWLLDKTKTSMGARKLQSWILSPLNDVKAINYRLEAVESLYNNTLIRQGLTNFLTSVRDVGRLTGKISNNNLMPKDCLALKNSLEVLPNIKFQLLGIQSELINDVSEKLYDYSDIVDLIGRAINENCPNSLKDGGYIKEGYNTELDQLKSLSKNSKACLAEIENREREKTGIKTLKINYNRVFGYYIEVSKSFKDKVPYEYERRQTLANAERYVTEELKDLETKLLSCEERALTLESKLFSQIKEILEQKIPALKETADAIASLDVILSLSIVARENSYTKPIILPQDKRLNIVDGRHPVIESISKQRFVPNDCVLDSNENRTMILTGPNMAGKSTYMRQVALITLMAHIGSFVPAKEAEIPLTDKIFTRIGASDNLISDQSTFMVEMTEVSNILHNATKNSLLILDEIGRGTSTYDGLSIAWAVVESITEQIGAKTLFATHYHELTELEGVLDGVKNYKVSVKEMQNAIIFLRKITRGGTNKSFGIEVAELAGVSKTVTDRAREILKKLEKSDIAKGKIKVNNTDSLQPYFSEVERIIKDVDINNLSPMQAFNVLADLHEKVAEKDK